jgi:hypothetical protein
MNEISQYGVMFEKLGTALPVPNQLGHRYCTSLKRGSMPVNVARLKFSTLKDFKTAF